MTRPATQGERLIALETAEKLRADTIEKAFAGVGNQLDKICERLDKIEAEARTTNERLSAYENRGKGALFGAALAGGGIVTAIATAWDKIKGLFL